MQDAIKDSVKNNSAIAAEKQKIKAASFASKVPTAEFLPSVSASMYIDPTLEDFIYHPNNSSSKPSSPTFYLDFRQNLFKFGGSLTKVKKGYHEYQKQKFISQSKIQEIVLSAVDVYLDLLKEGKTVELRKENIKSLKSALDSELEKLKYGNSTKGDVAKAQSKLSTAKSEYIQSKSAEQNKKTSFVRLTGKEPKNLAHPKIPTDKLPKDLDAAILLSKKNNPDLNASYNAKKSLEEEQKSAMTALFPSLDLTARITYGSTQNDQSIHQLGKSFALNLAVPIFQGGAEYMTILATHHNRVYAEQIYKYAYKSLEENVKIAWNDYENSKLIIQSAIDSVNAYQIALDSIKKEEEMNLKTANDVIDAHVDLLAAKVQLVQSKNLNVKYFCRLLIAIYGEQAIKFLQHLDHNK